MIIAMLVGLMLAQATPDAACVQMLRNKGARDLKKIQAVCACAGPEDDYDLKNQCLMKVYGWDLNVANEIVGLCLEKNGGASERNIATCACVVWRMIEAGPLENWQKATPEEIGRFTDRAEKACVPTTTASQ